MGCNELQGTSGSYPFEWAASEEDVPGKGIPEEAGSVLAQLPSFGHQLPVLLQVDNVSFLA